MKDRAKGRRRGQSFPSTPVHDLILFCSFETFLGIRIVVTSERHKERKRCEREQRGEAGDKEVKEKRSKRKNWSVMERKAFC